MNIFLTTSEGLFSDTRLVAGPLGDLVLLEGVGTAGRGPLCLLAPCLVLLSNRRFDLN